MNSFISLYTSGSGRISRKSWWLGVLGLVVASIIITLILSAVGLGMTAMPAIDPAHPELVAEVMRKGAWGSLITFVIMAYPSYNLSIKRRHDRNSAGRDFQIYLVLTLLVILAQALGLGLQMQDMGNGVMMPVPAMWFGAVSLVLGLLGIYMLVVLGFLRGTVGSNSFGADPAGGEWVPAA
jgi:uncharacterized membrane protein YhaH (DUF805 family)